MRIILASSSPRRKDLMAQIGLPFEVLEPTFAEEPWLEEAARQVLSLDECADLAVRIALQKAATVPAGPSEAGDGAPEAGWIVTADTIVISQGRILGKPTDADDARRMLEMLSGGPHHVVTGLALSPLGSGEVRSGASITRVTFRPLPSSLVEAYIATREPMDKAGAYGIQGRGAALVEAVDGCYFNVVGLPLALLSRLLEEAGLPVWTHW